MEKNLPFHGSPTKPSLVLPPLSCDSHCHVFGPAASFPFSSQATYAPVDAPKETLFARHRFLGFQRAVIVQASCHGTDNSAMVDALVAGGDTYRGVAVVEPDVSESELARLDDAGVRAVRFNFVKRLKYRQPDTVYKAIIEKIQPLGWHLIIHTDAEDIGEISPFLTSIDMPMVIDHMGRIPAGEGTGGTAFRNLATLLQDARFWIKLSGAERLSSEGPPYHDADALARGLCAVAPDRALWGSDWPHPNMDHIVDDGLLVDRIAVIAPDDEVRNKILVENPNRLYWKNDGRHRGAV